MWRDEWAGRGGLGWEVAWRHAVYRPEVLAPEAEAAMRPIGRRGGELARGGRTRGRDQPVGNARGGGKPTGDGRDGGGDYLADRSLLLLLFYFCYYHVLLILVFVYNTCVKSMPIYCLFGVN